MSHSAASFGDLLSHHRVAAGLSQASLAEAAGLSEQAISKLERGVRRAPRRDTVARLLASLPLDPVECAKLEAAVSRRRGPLAVDRSAPQAAWEDGALPISPTPLIGRERELAVVAALVGANRLVTLTGAGGVGKTRLALEAAGMLIRDFEDGVRLVELGALADPDVVPQAIATAFGIREQSGWPLLATLTSALQTKRVLLVLDNCEHLVGACANVAEAIVRRCPRTHVLATSREALRIAGETAWRVPSLATPPPDGPATAAQALQYGAVQLFVSRAVFAQLDFALSELTAAPVAQICRRLDGIPLAIELAAARLRVLTLHQLAMRLDDRFRILKGGSRTALPRHQTLRATIDWSYALLDEPERALFGRLSVFEGGFTLDAAESVCGTPGAERTPRDLLERLTGLVDKSLVAVETPVPAVPASDLAGTPLCAWYRLPDTTREYAKEKLAADAGAADVRARHAAFYLALCGGTPRPWIGPHAAAWFSRVEREYNNVRAALAWCLVERGDVGLGVRLAVAMRWFWSRRGYLSEGRLWLDRALASIDARRDPLRGGVLQGAAINAWRLGDYRRSASLSEENLALQRDLGDPKGIGEALYALGLVARDRGEYARSRAFLEEYREVEERRQDRMGIAWASQALGTVAEDQGDLVGARALYNQALSIWRDQGNRSDEAGTLCALGLLLCRLDECAAARRALESALATYRELGDSPGIAAALGNLAAVARRRGEESQARRLQHESLRLVSSAGDRRAVAAALERCASFASGPSSQEVVVRVYAAAEALRREIGAPVPPVDCPSHERSIVRARDSLGEDAFLCAWTAGGTMPLERALAEARTLVNDPVGREQAYAGSPGA